MSHLEIGCCLLVSHWSRPPGVTQGTATWCHVGEQLCLCTSGDQGEPSAYPALGEQFDPGGPVGLRTGPVLVGRLPREQPRESRALPGGAAARAGRRHPHRDRPALSAAGHPQALAQSRLSLRRTHEAQPRRQR